MTDRTWAAMWAALTATFGDPGRTEAEALAKARAYRLALSDLEDQALVSAVGRCLRECTRWPLPRDILDRVPGRMSEDEAAEAAWSRVLRSAASGPTTYHPEYGTRPTGADLDPLTLAAIGGPAGLYRLWQAEDDPRQTGFLRRDFFDRYRALSHLDAAGLLPTGEPRRQLSCGKDEPRRLAAVLEDRDRGDARGER